MAFVLLLCAHAPADRSSFNRCSKKTEATSENRKLQARVIQEQTELRIFPTRHMVYKHRDASI